MPNTLSETINKKLLEKLNLAFINVDSDMRVVQTSGNLAQYGYDEVAVGDDVTEHVDFLVGIDSDQALTLPVLASPAGMPVSVNLMPESGQLTVVIADAKDQFDLQQMLQQKANENQLLMEKQRKLLAQLHSAQTQLKEKNKKLEEASRLQSGFLSGVSHEFRTPLSAIIGYAELIQQDKSKEHNQGTLELKHNVEPIRRAGNHLLTLVENLLDHGRLDAGEIVINPKPVQVIALLKDVEQMMQPLARAKHIDLVFNDDIDPGHWAYIDESRLHQCLINLVGNAIKFTDSGSVVVTSYCDADILRVLIQDTGIGIAPEDLAKIRLPFWQASDTGKVGTGLGLSITERIIEVMGGSLSISSEIGVGTEVTMELSAPQTGEADEQMPVVKCEFDQKLSILLAEDDYDIAQLVVLLLEEANADVTHVENGELAVKAMRRQDFDLVLMDINMPVMNGYEAIKIVRGEGNEVPIIVMTASVIEADREQAQQLGCDGYLCKPVDVIDIVAIADQVLPRS
ncbi:MAG: response regulator [Arenicella sp.]|nr:response regulator [Arenicella sp.]